MYMIVFCLLHRYFQNPKFLESVGAGTTVIANVNLAQLIYQNSNTAYVVPLSGQQIAASIL